MDHYGLQKNDRRDSIIVNYEENQSKGGGIQLTGNIQYNTKSLEAINFENQGQTVAI